MIEYLVYGFKNYKNNSDILPEGNRDSLKKYNNNELKKKTLAHIDKLINPENIKIVLFSKYKFIISSKYMKYYFKNLTEMKKIEYKNEQSDKYEIKDLNKSQIFYMKTNDYDPNYIKIIYFIEKINNETYSELYLKSNYLNYIIDMISENKTGSLYYLLTNSLNYNIKSIDAYYKVIFKSKIYFEITFVLNCLKNINDIIFLTYQYLHKIVNEAIGRNLQIDRYISLRDLCYQNIKYTEKTFDTIDLARYNGENIIQTKYNPEYYFFFSCIPWNDNIEIIKKDTELYLSQLKPENSVIILGLREKDKVKLTCNDSSPFYLNCSYFKEEQNIKTTNYYNIQYINYIFNSSNFENYLKNDDINITYIKNSYISKHSNSLLNLKKEQNEFIKLENKINTLNKFYFKRNVNFFVPKVYIKLNLFHPYLRPNNTCIDDKKCYYFKILEIFSVIERKINDKFADAKRAGNDIDLGYNDNYLYINIFCYEDVAYKIMKEIKQIIYDTDWESTDFKANNEIYKNEAFDNYLVFDNNNILEISRYYLYCKLKNNLFNKYEFFPDNFEKNYYNKCISNIEDEYQYLKTFIINGTIYGFYTKENAQKIYDLFSMDISYQNFKIMLYNVNINIDNPKDYLEWVIYISKLNDQVKSVNISKEIYNKSENYNFGIRYFSFKEKLANVSLFKALIDRVKFYSYSNLVNFEMFVYRDIYFELLFYNNDKNIIIPNDKIVEKEWRNILNSCYIFNNPVDNIGNRYYYVRKNFLLTLVKQQTSLKQRAKDEITNYQNEGIILDPGKIYKKIKKEYSNKIDKNNLNNTLKYYDDIIFRSTKLDIHTLG